MNNEIWKPVKGYEGFYEVSNLGRVRSIVSECYLKPTKNRGGYTKILLTKDGERKHKLVHRLVAEAFIENPNKLPQINHKDEDKKNNKACNLEWCTAKYNANYGTRNKMIRDGNRGAKNGNTKLSEDDVREIRRLRESGLLYKEIADRLEITENCVGHIIRGERWGWLS